MIAVALGALFFIGGGWTSIQGSRVAGPIFCSMGATMLLLKVVL